MTLAAGRSVDRTAAEVWRAARGPVLFAVVVVLAAILLAISAGTTRSGDLDPRAATPTGSRAVAEVLRNQGVEVELVTTTAELTATTEADDTILVAFAERLVPSQVAAVLATRADLVVAGAMRPGRFVPGLEVGKPARTSVDPPECALPAARRAGPADAGAIRYHVDGGQLRGTFQDADLLLCYRAVEEGDASLVQVRSEGRTITFLGNPAPLRNDRFDDQGNAALALGLLGSDDRLVWYLPSLADIPQGQARSFYDLVPAGIWWGLTQAGVAVLLFALWRARRLGRVVAEPLPVVVRAAETVEGRARLYRRARARDKAADALRSGARSRLTPVLGLPRAPDPADLVDAVAARTGRTAPDVAALLYGAAPVDDVALVRLADDLDTLEREVRRP